MGSPGLFLPLVFVSTGLTLVTVNAAPCTEDALTGYPHHQVYGAPSGKEEN